MWGGAEQDLFRGLAEAVHDALVDACRELCALRRICVTGFRKHDELFSCRGRIFGPKRHHTAFAHSFQFADPPLELDEYAGRAE